MKQESFKIVHYLREDGSDPVEEFIDGITNLSQRASVISNITRLERTGLMLCRTNSCKVFNIKKQLYELVKSNTRIIFLAEGNLFILLHGFYKDSRKTYRSDVNITEERLKDYKKGD